MSLYIKSPITGDKIQIAEKDFPDEMTWDNAMSACAGLGGGWRLPNKEEQRAMYEQLHEHGKGNFKYAWYWSSSESNADNAWYFSFEYGEALNSYLDGDGFDYVGKTSTHHVRAVRTLP